MEDGALIFGAASSSSARGTIQVWKKRIVRRGVPAARRYSFSGLLRVVWQVVTIVTMMAFILQNMRVDVSALGVT